MVGIGAFRVFMRTRLNIEPYSVLKPTKVGFIFIGPNLKGGGRPATTSSRPSHLGILVLRLFCVKSFQFLKIKLFFKNLATLGRKIWMD